MNIALTSSFRTRNQPRYELDRKCERAVRFLDEATVEVAAQHGPKQFVFDNVFSEQHSQADVFEDTRRLVQSAIDGYARQCHKTSWSTIHGARVYQMISVYTCGRVCKRRWLALTMPIVELPPRLASPTRWGAKWSAFRTRRFWTERKARDRSFRLTIVQNVLG